jgi:hypothetical protein
VAGSTPKKPTTKAAENLRKRAARNLLKTLPDLVGAVYGGVPPSLADLPSDDPLRLQYRESARTSLLKQNLLTPAEIDSLSHTEATDLVMRRFDARLEDLGLGDIKRNARRR